MARKSCYQKIDEYRCFALIGNGAKINSQKLRKSAVKQEERDRKYDCARQYEYPFTPFIIILLFTIFICFIDDMFFFSYSFCTTHHFLCFLSFLGC